ncbi:copper amine oxidase N-terminal domain-containing protein [Paenibacillus sp. JMULE4]|nr:copper amine oxidase N-terminal domain-containing protein [Paenibacillus sp. JMULE4]
MMLEQAPVIEKGNTLIPIRFVTDALGGTVRWDDTERKVTVIRGGKMIDLWIDNPDLIVNGQRVTAEVPPVIMNNLTMVPLRILSENLGWKVTWDPQTRQVTLQ